MPGPAVYVAVGIFAFVAVVAFKEFIYDPHIQPALREWNEDRRRRRRHRGVPVAAHSGRPRSHDDGDNDDDEPLLNRSRGSQTSSAMHSSIELEDLVEHEQQAWRASGVDTASTGLRQRNVRGQPSTAPVHSIFNGEEHGMSGYSLAPALQASDREMLFEYPTSPTLSPARSPSPSSTSSLSLSLTGTLSPPPRSPSPPSSPSAHSAPISPPIRDASPSPSHSSTPDTELLSSSVITSLEEYLTPRSPQSVPSTPAQAPSQPPTVVGALSPRIGAISPFFELSPPSEPIELDAHSSSDDDEMFSVRSHEGDTDSDTQSSEDFENLSDEISSWIEATH